MLIMENSEEVMQILERFTKLKQKDIPKELEDYLCYVAKTGDTVYRWASIRYLFREKLVHVIKEFHDTTPSVDDLPQYPNVDPFNYETMKSALLERLELFNAAPFTVQRLCELLTDPRKQYSRIDKYMRALEKNILVVSTIEPGRKQADSENGDSLDSVVNGDLSLDVNVEIDMENESIFNIEPPNASSSSSAPKTDDDQVAPKKPKLDTAKSSVSEDKTPSNNTESCDSSVEDVKMATQEEDIQKEEEEESTSSSSSSKESEEQDEITSSTEPKDVTNKSDLSTPNPPDNTESQEPDVNPTRETEKVDAEDVAKEHAHSEPLQNEAVLETTNTEDKEEHITPIDTSEEPQSITTIILPRKDSEINIDDKPVDKVQTEEVLPTECREAPTASETPLPEDIKTDEETSDKDSQSPLESLPVQPESVHKIPEQMSVEETAATNQEISPCPPTDPLIIPSELSTSTDISEQQIPDQPMDENLESTVSSTCQPEASCLNEVVMQSEIDMATDPDPIKLADDKADLAGMDVDDTSQEEAMDQ